MATKKKNSNYVTEKNAQKQEAIAKKKRSEKTKKLVKTIALVTLITVLVVGAIVAGLYFIGVFDYVPEGTSDVLISFGDGKGSLHVSLYGHDAPKTVAYFQSLVQRKYFNDKTVNFYKDGNLYIGAGAEPYKNGVEGEFSANGKENKIPFEVGTLVMARGEGYDSGYGRFFIVTEETDVAALQGNYAAFGKITGGYDVIKDIISKLTPNSDGSIYFGEQVKILSISTHDSH
jgi:cyclophilin family peptidyl-prolyl cis-trans isomerase